MCLSGRPAGAGKQEGQVRTDGSGLVDSGGGGGSGVVDSGGGAGSGSVDSAASQLLLSYPSPLSLSLFLLDARGVKRWGEGRQR